MCVCVSRHLRVDLCVWVMCVSLIFSSAFLGVSILDFDVGNGDGGDSRSFGRAVPIGQRVRGEERRMGEEKERRRREEEES